MSNLEKLNCLNPSARSGAFTLVGVLVLLAQFLIIDIIDIIDINDRDVAHANPAREATRELRFKDQPLELQANDRLIVQIPRGSVRLIPIAAGGTSLLKARKTLSVSQPPAALLSAFDNLQIQVKREAGILMIESKGPETRSAWLSAIGGKAPELHLEIHVPALSSEVHLHSGSVQAQNWKADLRVTIVEGSLRVQQSVGQLDAFVSRGEARIENHKGQVQLESHAAKIGIQNLDGDLRIGNFAGESNLQQIKGQVVVRHNSGTLQIQKLNGALDFDSDRGQVNAQGIEGQVKGYAADGQIQLGLAGEADVKLETLEAGVQISAAKGMGYSLRMNSTEGQIVAPAGVEVSRGTGPKSAQGRLPGVAKGQIVVRTQRGTIRVR